MPTGTSFIPLDVLFNCVSPCCYKRFTVRCAAYAAWTTPGLARTDKTCVKLTCLYQVRGYFTKVYTSVSYSASSGACFTGLVLHFLFALS